MKQIHLSKSLMYLQQKQNWYQIHIWYVPCIFKRH